MTYDARVLTPHPAFSKFSEETRRALADRLYGGDHIDPYRIPETFVVNGEPIPASCCPIGWCLIHDGVVQVVATQIGNARTIVGLADDVVIFAKSPVWWEVAYVLGDLPDLDMSQAGRDNGTYGRVEIDEPDTLRAAATNRIPIDGSASPYYQFYFRWDSGRIDQDEMLRDWLGIDAFEHV